MLDSNCQEPYFSILIYQYPIYKAPTDMSKLTMYFSRSSQRLSSERDYNLEQEVMQNVYYVRINSHKHINGTKSKENKNKINLRTSGVTTNEYYKW